MFTKTIKTSFGWLVYLFFPWNGVTARMVLTVAYLHFTPSYLDTVEVNDIEIVQEKSKKLFSRKQLRRRREKVYCHSIVIGSPK